MRKLIIVLFILITIGGIVYLLNFFSTGNLTSNEQVLFSILLTIGSFFLSWFVSQFYYEKSHEDSINEIKKDYQSNLKIYASKAAEKVKNLSTEFSKLANYLKQEFDDDEYESDRENLNAKRERIYSSIHIVNTLKSINDGSLSDWKGIIPEEIAEIAEEEREKVANINTILNEYQNIVKSSEVNSSNASRDTEFRTEMELLNKKLDLAINNVIGVSTKSRRNTLKKEEVSNPCPNCSSLISYKQKPTIKSQKWIKCLNCGTKLDCRWNTEEGFILLIHQPVINEISSVENLSSKFDQSIIEMIIAKLPPQPWPKGTGQQVAQELNIPFKQVKKVIDFLIDNGTFRRQIDGKLYPDN